MGIFVKAHRRGRALVEAHRRHKSSGPLLRSPKDIRTVASARSDEIEFNANRKFRLAKKAGERARKIQTYRLEILSRRG